MSEKLTKLQEELKKIQNLNHITSLLYWDMKTIMPKEGFGRHSEVLTAFSTDCFKLETSDELYALVKELNAPCEYESLDDDWKFIVKRMLRDMEESRRIPAEFFSEMVQAQAESSVAWEEAKNASDFSIFAPHLEKMISEQRQKALYMQPDKDPYDTMIGWYEEGMDVASIDRIFEELKKELIPLVKDILSRPKTEDARFFRPTDLNAQKQLEKVLLRYIGFDFNKGCTGESEHPFTLELSANDVRVTNHFQETNPIDPMFSAIHEGGHAIFEQNIKPSLDGTAGGSCSYMGIHESQSRFYENILGRRKAFWIPIYGELQKILPTFADISIDDFVKEINHVRASMIRTESDEVTYCLHILLRYEMEKEIFRNNVPVSELPVLWNQKMEEFLGVTPANDAEGILQDMHWSDGGFGYFPSYLLGSIYDGMFLEKMEEELGSVDEILEKGEILKITAWLNEKIHQYGSTRLPKEVIEKVTGKPLSSASLIRYFKEKHGK